MKKWIMFITGLLLNICVACNPMRERAEEEELYNPFDTSEQLEDVESDTIYSLDSVEKRFELGDTSPLQGGQESKFRN